MWNSYDEKRVVHKCQQALKQLNIDLIGVLEPNRKMLFSKRDKVGSYTLQWLDRGAFIGFRSYYGQSLQVDYIQDGAIVLSNKGSHYFESIIKAFNKFLNTLYAENINIMGVGFTMPISASKAKINIEVDGSVYIEVL